VETKAVDNLGVVLPPPPIIVASTPAPVPVVGKPPTVAASAPATAAGAVVAPKATASAASILAITDDPELRDTLLEMAIAEGFGVRCAATEADAAALIHAERPGLVLVDLDMPGRTGAKFLRTLRASPYRDIRCLIVTASNDPMLTVSLDAPVFFKPSLEGLDAALERLFGHGTT
jgi:CheY-like chemotaxis protein